MACSVVGCPSKHPSGIIARRQFRRLLPRLKHGRVESINQLVWYHAQFNTPTEWCRQFCSGETVFVPKADFPSGPYGAGTRENPVNLSDTTTEASQTAMCPEGTEPVDEAAMLGHFSDALSEMAASLMDLEDGYF